MTARPAVAVLALLVASCTRADPAGPVPAGKSAATVTASDGEPLERAGPRVVQRLSGRPSPDASHGGRALDGRAFSTPAEGLYIYETRGRERYGSLTRTLPNRSTLEIAWESEGVRRLTLRRVDAQGNGSIQWRLLSFEHDRALLEAVGEERRYGGAHLVNVYDPSGEAVDFDPSAQAGSTWTAELRSRDGCYEGSMRRTVRSEATSIRIGSSTLPALEVDVEWIVSTAGSACHRVETQTESRLVLWRDNGLILSETSRTEGTVGAFALEADIEARLTDTTPRSD